MIPIMRPKLAPMAIEGTKIPAGTLHPYEMMTRPMRITVARNKEFTMRHCAEVLQTGMKVKISSQKTSTHWHRLS